MTMQHGRCHWTRALCQVSGRACSCKKDPCSFTLSSPGMETLIMTTSFSFSSIKTMSGLRPIIIIIIIIIIIVIVIVIVIVNIIIIIIIIFIRV